MARAMSTIFCRPLDRDRLLLSCPEISEAVDRFISEASMAAFTNAVTGAFPGADVVSKDRDEAGLHISGISHDRCQEIEVLAKKHLKIVKTNALPYELKVDRPLDGVIKSLAIQNWYHAGEQKTPISAKETADLVAGFNLEQTFSDGSFVRLVLRRVDQLGCRFSLLFGSYGGGVPTEHEFQVSHRCQKFAFGEKLQAEPLVATWAGSQPNSLEGAIDSRLKAVREIHQLHAWGPRVVDTLLCQPAQKEFAKASEFYLDNGELAVTVYGAGPSEPTLVIKAFWLNDYQRHNGAVGTEIYTRFLKVGDEGAFLAPLRAKDTPAVCFPEKEELTLRELQERFLAKGVDLLTPLERCVTAANAVYHSHKLPRPQPRSGKAVETSAPCACGDSHSRCGVKKE